MNSKHYSRTVLWGILLVFWAYSATSLSSARADTLSLALGVPPAGVWVQPAGEDLYTDGYSPAYSWRAYQQERRWEKRQRKAEHRYWKARRKYYKRMYKAERKYDRSIYGY
ncbi:hypothetical protein HFU84_04410 [Acidithiobacillus sp. CV18-2]|uniref:Uncharacterized protein n=1 Tax=Igneacidithiobacillus copahuensis TaxID=2724909 RepID=A0AAE2YS73_9PROT|nr:hypothetical protein [Igneacidithiobacillus copahuensis]MBU2754178.1 hypothetical protein [Acidithiobacillus sp. CV18-3]MBU2758486.1 hypothetical protein [Acidithiobacillus sp. BN09-2]MBU2776758.1 hypothetical protein [Acidithiobacillus sp. CV18-2]MBU2797083.1 hypothetical protein [Acidithiobacillus sp. VAN18-2]MBU2798469.1 hypothetical protein [Acidithiobacillus sp. VAN18-4]UTV80152.1 hypothetical protein MQE22_08960 [Acidithiobacillus sp. YTS05]